MKAYVIATRSFTSSDRYLYVDGSFSCTDNLHEAALFATESSAVDEAFRQSSLRRQSFWPIRVEVTTEGVVNDD